MRKYERAVSISGLRCQAESVTERTDGMPSSHMLIEIGDRLRGLREEMELTQKEVAGLLGLSETFYGEIERGNKRLSIEKLILLRQTMGVDLTYLLTGDRFTTDFISRIYRRCPKEKKDVMENLLREISKLYR